MKSEYYLRLSTYKEKEVQTRDRERKAAEGSLTAYAENLKKIESEKRKSKSDFFKEETSTLPKVKNDNIA